MIPFVDLSGLQIGRFTIQPFGFLVAIGIIVGAFLARRRAIQVGLDPQVIRNFVRLSAVAGIPGSHAVDLLISHPHKFAADPWSIFKFWSGMSSVGGFLCAALAVVIYTSRKRIPFFPYADVFMFGFFPCWFFARLGCATAHDHPGDATNFFLGVRFPDGPRHDLGLYEALLGFLWIPFLWWLGRKREINDPPAGAIFWTMLVAYSVPRFCLDFLRANDLRYFGFTFPQYVCAAFTVLGVVSLIRLQPSRGHSQRSDSGSC